MQNKSELELVVEEAQRALEATHSLPDLDQWKSRVLGKKGVIADQLKGMKDLDPEERIRVGGEANAAKKTLESAYEERKQSITSAEVSKQLDAEWLDLTAQAQPADAGRLHPLTSFARELEDIFGRMGFQILEGPLVEDDWHNFEALNIPPEHPARDMQDTFFSTQGAVLRTHTSSVQIRAMERLKPPFRGVAAGRVFRCEEVDATHGHTFHQLEGLLIDRDISVAHLRHFLKTMLSEVFQDQIEVRLRHSYFPFVEPGFEVDIRRGGGQNWMELLGCGLVHPNVLRSCKIDPEVWSGFAFGMGLERLAMNRYGINDLRHFFGADLRFIRQFG